jgi:antitoxin component of RelBE/YafQ-DinJ toxin-antitoxin module
MPADEQLNIRVPAEVKQRFRARARREGMSQSQLLEALLRARIVLPAPPPRTERPERAEASESVPEPAVEVDFALWLQGRTGVPKVLTGRAIEAGRVTVDGVPYTARTIPQEHLRHVAYEGAAI